MVGGCAKKRNVYKMILSRQVLSHLKKKEGEIMFICAVCT